MTARAQSYTRGILLMLVAVVLFVAIDTMSKYLGRAYPVVEVTWARYFFHFLTFALFLRTRLIGAFRTRRPVLQLVRSAFLVAASLFFIKGLTLIPLADASAIIFMAPILVTALSWPILGETVGFKRWISIGAAFLGALVIIRPGTSVMQVGALYPLATSVCYAIYMIATRSLAKTDDSMTTSVFSAFVGAVACSAIVPFQWVAPSSTDWIVFVAIGVVGGISHFLLILAFEAAPAAVVSPLDYSRLIWAAVVGYLMFGDLPDMWTVAGAGIIVASGLYILRHDYRRNVHAE